MYPYIPQPTGYDPNYYGGTTTTTTTTTYGATGAYGYTTTTNTGPGPVGASSGYPPGYTMPSAGYGTAPAYYSTDPSAYSQPHYSIDQPPPAYPSSDPPAYPSSAEHHNSSGYLAPPSSYSIDQPPLSPSSSSSSFSSSSFSSSSSSLSTPSTPSSCPSSPYGTPQQQPQQQYPPPSPSYGTPSADGAGYGGYGSPYYDHNSASANVSGGGGVGAAAGGGAGPGGFASMSGGAASTSAGYLPFPSEYSSGYPSPGGHLTAADLAAGGTAAPSSAGAAGGAGGYYSPAPPQPDGGGGHYYSPAPSTADIGYSSPPPPSSSSSAASCSGVSHPPPAYPSPPAYYPPPPAYCEPSPYDYLQPSFSYVAAYEHFLPPSASFFAPAPAPGPAPGPPPLTSSSSYSSLPGVGGAAPLPSPTAPLAPVDGSQAYFYSAASIAMAASIQSDTFSLLQHGLVVDSSGSPGFAGMTGTQSFSDEEMAKQLEAPSKFVLYISKEVKKEVNVFLSSGGMHLHVDNQAIYLGDIEAIRLGHKTEVFKQLSQTLDPSLCFSVQYGLKYFNLSALNHSQFNTWVNGLIRLVASLRELSSDYAYVKSAWARLGKSTATVAEARGVLARMNLHPVPDFVGESLRPGSQSFDFAGFVTLLRRCRRRPEIRQLFDRYARGAATLSPVQLLEFVKNEQQEVDFLLEHALEIIYQFGDASSNTLTPEGFEAYLTSGLTNSFENPYMRQVYHDMTRPLHEYFIASSHNTYLEGNQLTSKSSTEMYIRVLKTGCRCIELDCWDGADGRPIITHGGTLTTKLVLEDVLRVIKKYAFYASEYPLILSLENHTTPSQQVVMADLFIRYLGDSLAPPTQHLRGNSSDCLPSPASLMRKILLKGPIGLDTPSPTGSVGDICPELSRIVHLGPSLLTADPNLPPYRMTSLSESKLKSTKTADLVPYTHKHLVRIYPKGGRIDSSNPDPVEAWVQGCQMVALNYQDPALPLLLNLVKFSDNGGCGYLLKPEYLRNDPHYHPSSDRIPPSPYVRFSALHIRILSARQLPSRQEAQLSAPSFKTSAKNLFSSLTKGRKNSTPEPPQVAKLCAQIEVHGVPADRKKHRTSGVLHGDFGPSWDQTFSFSFQAPDLAILTFSILQTATFDTKLCHAGVPLSSLRPGFRVIPMREPSLKYLPMTDLFCQFIFA